ncbi:type IV pilus biogenesis protein PilM [Microbacterium sp. JZ31]|uniref:type IV pilus biogenesis protein PilM n=1 Tax=Microbacterium sp. JZ31 TaxID=1906274 RepID=UPI001934591B|nr:type IV pilus assembly protein PilM [Microbacterium sp. JZ31]
MARMIGLDFDSDSVRAAEVSGIGTPEPRIERYGEVRLPAGAISNGEVMEPNTVADALQRLWQAAKFSTRAVALGIGSHRVIARPLIVEDGRREQVRASLPMYAEELLPFPTDEALMDFYPIERPADQPGRVRGLLVAAARDAVDDNVRTVRRAKLRPESVDLVPFALARTHLRGGIAQGTVGLVEIGASSTNVLIGVHGVPQFLRIIPSGGDEVVRQLAAVLATDEETAARMMRSEHPDREALLDAAAPLVNAIANTLDYYANTHADGALQHILLTGSAAGIPTLHDQLQARIRRMVTLANPLHGLRIGKKVDPRALTEGAPGVAIGLALGVAS